MLLWVTFSANQHVSTPPLLTVTSELWEQATLLLFLNMGLFLESPGNVLGPKIRLKLLVQNGTSDCVKNMWIKQLCNHIRFAILLRLLVRKLFGTIEKRAPGYETRFYMKLELYSMLQAHLFQTNYKQKQSR